MTLELKWSGESFEYEALVDSGADYCLFSSEVAELIGIKPAEGVEITLDGIGSEEICGYIHNVVITFEGKEYVTAVVFSDCIAEYSYGILGQAGFFDRHEVAFNHQEKTFTITE